jgi:hypothetical protein
MCEAGGCVLKGRLSRDTRAETVRVGRLVRMWWNGGRRADHSASRDGVGAWDESMRGNVQADLQMRDMVG